MILLLTLMAALAPYGKAEAEVDGHVGYISGETVYIDIGYRDGVSTGDTLQVIREGALIGRMTVLSTASHASSCSPLFPVTEIEVGDLVRARAIPLPATEEVKPQGVEKEAERGPYNLLSGRIALGSLLSEDLTSSGLDFSQPSLSTRIEVDDIVGRPISLRLRHRSRYYARQSRLGGENTSDRWTHQVFELALTYRQEGAPLFLQVGRILPSAPSGLGYVDGAMIALRPSAHITVGGTGGTRPDLLTSGFRRDVVSIGAFSSYETRNEKGGQATLSGSFTGNYRSGEISREYFSLEGDYTDGGRISTSGNVELDLNRGWRKGSRGRSLEPTSLYLYLRYQLEGNLSLRLSFDRRRQPRTLDNISTPDSLFDNSARRGLHTGVSWTPSSRIHISGGFGVRFRGEMDNIISASGRARLRDFPVAGVVTDGGLSIFEGMFTSGYRPMVSFSLSPCRDLGVDVRGGDSIYHTGNDTNHNPWIGSALRYRLNSHHYLALSFTGYLSGRLRSAQVFAETGVVF